MNKNLKRVFSLVLVTLLTLSFTGCSKGGSSELSDKIVYVYEDEDGNKVEATESDGTVSDNKKPTSSTDKDTSKKPNKRPGKQNIVNDNVDAAEYEGTEVIFATWRDPKLNEDKEAVESFEREYGIKLKTELISEGSYTQTILGRIVSGKSPDVFFCTYTFPACLKALQPIDAAKLNLKESIWDQSLIKLATVNGKSYMVNSISNLYNDFDVVYYNKKIFKQNNITSPADYVKNGKWTFEAMKKCMQDVQGLGSNYKGGIIALEGLLASSGEGFLRYRNGRFENGYSSKQVEMLKWVATGYKEGYITGVEHVAAQKNFPAGNVGIAMAHAWCLRKSGGFNGMNPDDIGFVQIPSWDGKTPSRPATFVRGWGICDGAKNPVGAGIFLRHYLDIDNYDTKSAFINKEASDFFFKCTTKQEIEKTNRYYVFGDGVGSLTVNFQGTYQAAKTDPAQVQQRLDSQQNTYNDGVKILNTFLEGVK